MLAFQWVPIFPKYGWYYVPWLWKWQWTKKKRNNNSYNYIIIRISVWYCDFFRGGDWGASREQNCYSETEPITKGRYRHNATDDQMMKIITTTINGLRERDINVQIINITRLSENRKEGHPSIYRKQWEPLTEEQLLNPRSYADCIHWCLPGVPDVWNELLYAYIFSK